MSESAATLSGVVASDRPSMLAEAVALVRRHVLGIAAALLLAGLLVGPRWWLLATEPGDGERIQLSPWGAGTFGYDQALYTPNIRQAFDGRFPVAAQYGGGGDETPVQTGGYFLQAIGWLGHFTGDIFSSLALVTTLAAAAAFLLFYAMAHELTRSRLAAIAVMPIAVMGVQIILQTDGITPLRHAFIRDPVLEIDPGLDFHAWARFVAPILPLPGFFGAVMAVPKAVETGRRGWIVAAAACIALMVYSYLFYWTAAALALVLWGGWLLLRRDLDGVRRLAIVGALAAIFALPELASAAYSALQFSADMGARLGTGTPAGSDNTPLFLLAQRFLLGVPFLLALLRGPDRNRLYILLFVVPLVLERAPTGLPQPFHYTLQVWPALAIPAFVAGGAEIWKLLGENSRRVAAAGLGVLAVIGAGHFTVFQVRATYNLNSAFAIRADEKAAFEWIEDNAGRDDVFVSSSITTNMYIASLTDASKYLVDGFVADPSDEELIDRYLRVSAVYGYAPDDVFARLDPIYRCAEPGDPFCAVPSVNFPFKAPSFDLREREAQLETHMAYYLLNWQITHPERIQQRLDGWREKYDDLLRTDNVLAAYEAGYIYCGPREGLWPSSISDAAPSVGVAFEQGEVIIYEIVGATDDGAEPFPGC